MQSNREQRDERQEPPERHLQCHKKLHATQLVPADSIDVHGCEVCASNDWQLARQVECGVSGCRSASAFCCQCSDSRIECSTP